MSICSLILGTYFFLYGDKTFSVVLILMSVFGFIYVIKFSKENDEDDYQEYLEEKENEEALKLIHKKRIKKAKEFWKAFKNPAKKK